MAAVMALSGCAATRPSQPMDLCAIFDEKPEWYASARESYQRWGVPIPLQLAVIHQESSFDSDARPPRTSFLWIFPGPRPSSAYGYGQVLDGTWDDYREYTDHGGADRDDFGDVTDFIGWYGFMGARRFGIPRDDPYAFYLSYQVGHSGYQRRVYRNKSAVLRAAQSVTARTRRYTAQYGSCGKHLEQVASNTSWWPW